jgi:NACalpha-BTF3-like transcription factor
MFQQKKFEKKVAVIQLHEIMSNFDLKEDDIKLIFEQGETDFNKSHKSLEDIKKDSIK